MRKQTILITGASSGIGLATARYFDSKGWQVIAANRNPDSSPELLALPTVKRVKMDVTDPTSIAAAVEQTLQSVDKLDVLVNNAGYGLAGVFEACTPQQIRKQFDTNFFGVCEVTRAVLPHFRKNRSGRVINISSVGGRTTIPLYSLYHASKFAVEGFTESLRFELEPLGISVHLVEPGAVKTDFSGRSADFASIQNWPDYQAYQDRVIAALKKAADSGAPADQVAHDIFSAATGKASRLRYVSGSQAKFFLLLQRLLPASLYHGLLKRSFG